MYYFINNKNWSSGPGIFGSRLDLAMGIQGHRSMAMLSDDLDNFMNLSIITGNYAQHAFNVLRLNGLYMDSEDPETDAKNAPIFKCYREYDHIIFQSQGSKDAYEFFLGGKPSTIIHNGVPAEFNPKVIWDEQLYAPFRPWKEKYRKVCITAASWRRHKRLEELVEAFHDPSLSDVCLVALGAHDYKLANVPDNVKLAPTFAPHVLPHVYAAGDAFLYLSWLDWCPNVVVEALSCGLPVLCTHNGGTHELVKDNGVVIQLEDDYVPGSRVPLYKPPTVDTSVIVGGIHRVLEMEKGFHRPDLSIHEVAKQYISVGENREGAIPRPKD